MATLNEDVSVKLADTVLRLSQRVSLSSVLAKGILTAELAAPLRRRDRHPHVDPEVLALAQPLFQTPAFKKTNPQPNCVRNYV